MLALAALGTGATIVADDQPAPPVPAALGEPDPRIATEDQPPARPPIDHDAPDQGVRAPDDGPDLRADAGPVEPEQELATGTPEVTDARERRTAPQPKDAVTTSAPPAASTPTPAPRPKAKPKPAPPATTAPAPSPSPTPVVASAPAVTSRQDLAGTVAGHINATRARAGLPALQRSGTADDVANAWARRMAADGEQRHNPRYGDQLTAALGAGAAAENVGVIQGADLARLHKAFEASAGHRANLTGDYTVVGVGVAADAQGRFWVVHNLWRPS